MDSHSAPTDGAPPAVPPAGERRRPGWGEFRRSYPGLVATMALALAVMLALDGWIIYKRVKYAREVERLRSGMTSAERKKADLLLASDENKFRVMVALIRRQAQVDKEIHLSVSVDSGMMYLEREGALLREMRAEIGPEKLVGTSPDTIRMAIPRGTRTVERVLGATDPWEVPRWVYTDRRLAIPGERSLRGALGPVAVVLNGGTVIYTMPSAGPLNDSSYVMPGAVRVRAQDLKAVTPNLARGSKVYFY